MAQRISPITRILVTGANGYIGKYLLKRLQDEPDMEIFGLTRNESLPAAPRLFPICADISSAGWTRLLPDNMDAVIHLAQSRHYRDFPEHADDLRNININATGELLDWSRRNRVRYFLFASTGNVYDTHTASVDETSPCEPGSMYAATKLSAELLVKQYSGFFATTIMRIFGVYGPAQQGMIVPMIMDRILGDQEITLAQGVGLYLTPLYVTDCIEYILRLLHTAGGKGNSIFNLCGDEVITLQQIVEQLENLLLKKARVRHTADQPKHLTGNNGKLASAVGYRPKVHFAAGISKAIRERINENHF